MFRIGGGNFQSKLKIVSPPQLRVAAAYHGSHFYACLFQLRDFESVLWFDKDITGTTCWGLVGSVKERRQMEPSVVWNSYCQHAINDRASIYHAAGYHKVQVKYFITPSVPLNFHFKLLCMFP